MYSDGVTRAAIYLRLSKETEASTSIARQRKDCLALAKSRGWEVVTVAEDVDVSASVRRLDRPGLDRIRAEYANLDAVIFWKSDRLARSVLDFSALMEEAEAAGVALVSATEPLDFSTPMGRAMAQIVAIFAEMEAKTIGLRVRSSIAHLRQSGLEPGGRVPYGWRRVPAEPGPGTVLEVDPDEGAVVREAVRRVIGGEPVLAVCKDFTARGIPTDSGGARWNTSTLNGILRNPALLGYSTHRGEVVKGPDGLPLAPRPALVSGNEWRQLQEALASRSGPRRRPTKRTSLLTGLGVCARCGSRLVAHSRATKTGLLLYYVCSSTGRGGDCPGVSVKRERLDEFVADSFLAAFGDHAELRPIPAAPGATAEDVEGVRLALDDLERDRYERGLFSGPEGASRFAELHARLSARLEALKGSEGRSRTWELTGRSLREAWGASDVLARRVMLESALAEPIRLERGAKGGAIPIHERASVVWKSAGDAPTMTL